MAHAYSHTHTCLYVVCSCSFFSPYLHLLLFPPLSSISEGLIIKKSISSFLSEFRCHPPYLLNVTQVLTLARHFQDKVCKLSSHSFLLQLFHHYLLYFWTTFIVLYYICSFSLIRLKAWTVDQIMIEIP